MKYLQQMMYLKQRKRGFTLIELLVTVMIVGILAAIAVPQYQRAVYKSRFSGMMPIAKTLAGANEVYYAEHSQYASQPQDLNVTVQQERPDGTELEFGSDPEYSYVLASNPGVANSAYVVYQKHSENFPDNIHCEALDTDEKATWLCRDALQGTPINTGEIKSLSGEGYTAYLLSGSTTGSTFDRSCEGDAPTEEGDTCPSGCGKMTATASCNPYTGEWNEPEFDDNSCPSPLPDDTQQCENGTGMKVRHSQCKSDGSGYEYGAWDESECCTGNPPTITTSSYTKTDCGNGRASGSSPVCVNGQWELASFSSNLVCEGTSAKCTSKSSGAANGGPCTGTYRNATCNAKNQFGCVASTVEAGGFNTSYCDGKAEYGCANSTFRLINTSGGSSTRSYCQGSESYACANSNFEGPGRGSGAMVQCLGSKAYSCVDSTFTNQAYCYGMAANACKGSTFKSYSVCYASAPGGCDGVTYDGGCCFSYEGYCPAGSPRCIQTFGQYVTMNGTW